MSAICSANWAQPVAPRRLRRRTPSRCSKLFLPTIPHSSSQKYSFWYTFDDCRKTHVPVMLFTDRNILNAGGGRCTTLFVCKGTLIPAGNSGLRDYALSTRTLELRCSL